MRLFRIPEPFDHPDFVFEPKRDGFRFRARPVPHVVKCPKMARPRIVVADDHDKTRTVIATLLASDFDVVATVADGQAAVEAARALDPDLVVLDISMPGLNGFEAGILIRDLPDPRRIVFATAYEDASIPSAPAARGASAVVWKREMLTELVPAIRRALLFHAVCFYDDSPSLVRTVARFIAAQRSWPACPFGSGVPDRAPETRQHRVIAFGAEG